jgi:hypothetical protein
VTAGSWPLTPIITFPVALSANFYTGWPVTLQLADGSLITSYTGDTRTSRLIQLLKKHNWDGVLYIEADGDQNVQSSIEWWRGQIG